MKKIVPAVIFVLLFAVVSMTSNAQFLTENHYLGPTLGFSFLGSVPEFGAAYEYGMEIEDIGIFGIGGLFKYWSYRTTHWSYTNVVVGAQGNYHFVLDNTDIDPYFGLVLAYFGGSLRWRGMGQQFLSPSHGGLYLAAQGGVRYFLSPTLALGARVGFGSLGYSAVTFGLDFRL